MKPRCFARRISSWAAARTWLTVPGALSSESKYMVWIESMTTTSLRPSSSEATMSRMLVAAASPTGAALTPEARGAQPHLIERLLAGDVGAFEAGAAFGRGQRRHHLQQHGRLADAGIAAHQQRRARHHAAAADAVELGDAGNPPRQRRAGAGKPGKGQLPAPGAAQAPGRALARQLLDERVPAAAGVAPPGPFRLGGAAFLTDEARLRACHF